MAEGNQTKAVIGQTFVELCETKELNKISIQELAEIPDQSTNLLLSFPG